MDLRVDFTFDNGIGSIDTSLYLSCSTLRSDVAYYSGTLSGAQSGAC